MNCWAFWRLDDRSSSYSRLVGELSIQRECILVFLHSILGPCSILARTTPPAASSHRLQGLLQDRYRDMAKEVQRILLHHSSLVWHICQLRAWGYIVRLMPDWAAPQGRRNASVSSRSCVAQRRSNVVLWNRALKFSDGTSIYDQEQSLVRMWEEKRMWLLDCWLSSLGHQLIH